MEYDDLYLLFLKIDIQHISERYIQPLIIIFLLITVGVLIRSFVELNKRHLILRQIEEFRLDYFTKLTHEIKAPLTIILGLSKQLKDQRELSQKSYLTSLNAIERQGRNLYELVSQILDTSILEDVNQIIEWETGNIVAFVEMISESFAIYAEQKEIELVFFCDEKEIVTDFVPNFLNKILNNLLTNAIDFCEEGSKIYLQLERDKKDKSTLQIKVIDQGEGISSSDIPHIFDMYYKGNPDGDHPGNGIGLSLTKQLVEMLHGNIKVESAKEKGTIFIIEIPIERNNRKIYPIWITERKSTQTKKEELTLLKDINKKPLIPNKEDPRRVILLIEDNINVAQYIKDLFNEDRYNIIYANNGKKALELANQFIPDIIVTDIIMPQKNGIEFCKEIRSSPTLNHIPIIIVSAKYSEADLVESIKNGADAYIRKPFIAEELKARVEYLLESRYLLKEKYVRTAPIDEKNLTDTGKNIDFIRHVTDIIYREMKNPDFSSKKLANDLTISTSQLNKKLKETTGYTSSTYILHIKVTHAKKILISTNKSIGEVAADCGIYDLNYFSRIFKKHTNLTPTQYQRLPKK